MCILVRGDCLIVLLVYFLSYCFFFCFIFVRNSIVFKLEFGKFRIIYDLLYLKNNFVNINIFKENLIV